MRRENDFYPTPGFATRELVRRIPIRGNVFEPCVGAGDILRELETCPRIRSLATNDLDRTHAAMMHADATDSRWWNTLLPYDWVVTNPPFVVADKILPLAFQHVKVGVAMLLRLTYLEPCEGRGAWLDENPPTILIVLPRISFTGDGDTDSVTCAWMVWDKRVDWQRIEIVNPRDERQGSLLDPVASEQESSDDGYGHGV